MTLSRRYVLNALLRRNYFPTVRTVTEELPPIITSKTFKPSVARRLQDSRSIASRGTYPGYDSIDYKLTRFNGVSRNLSIPHPRAYAELALCIYKNWRKFDHISENLNSLIRPRRHKDKRIIIMNYDSHLPKARRSLDKSFGKRFRVRTDITNFYPSVYSHSVPWALVGHSKAKAHRGNNEKWYNKLDKAIQLTKRNETQGIAIGPATSNILSEIILTSIDKKLKHEFIYSRFIDDYVAYCNTHVEAESFIMCLEEELRQFNLVLNVSKTGIDPLPQPLRPGWVGSLSNILPKPEDISKYNVIAYLDHATRLSNQTPDGSVLKYAVKSLTASLTKAGDKLDVDILDAVLNYTLNLAYHHPNLIPSIGGILDKSVALKGEFIYTQEIGVLTQEFVRRRLSDAVCWSLYYSYNYGLPLDECIADRIIESEDCLSLLFLYLSQNRKYQDLVVDFVYDLDRSDLYELDRFWLLQYQLYLDGKIKNPYRHVNDHSFSILKEGGVNFIQSPSQ